MGMLDKTTRKTERVGVGYLVHEGLYVARINVKGLRKGKRCKTFEEAVAVREEFERQAEEIKKNQVKEEKKKEEKTKKVCNEYCDGCMYQRTLYWPKHSGIKYCDYLGVESKCRPCAAGTGCTVKKQGNIDEYIAKLKSVNNLFI